MDNFWHLFPRMTDALKSFNVWEMTNEMIKIVCDFQNNVCYFAQWTDCRKIRLEPPCLMQLVSLNPAQKFAISLVAPCRVGRFSIPWSRRVRKIGPRIFTEEILAPEIHQKQLWHKMMSVAKHNNVVQPMSHFCFILYIKKTFTSCCLGKNWNKLSAFGAAKLNTCTYVQTHGRRNLSFKKEFSKRHCSICEREP